jgi:hypothetical protein
MTDTSDDYNRAAFELIVSLRSGLPVRSGLPEHCDFCGQPFDYDALRSPVASLREAARYPIPEEAGEWTCSECAKRWGWEVA